MRTFALIKKELLQFWRDPALVAVVLWCFSLDVYLCAKGFSVELKNYPIAIRNMDGSQASLSLIDHILPPKFRIVKMLTDDRDYDELLLSGKVQMILEIDKDFSRDIAMGRAGKIQVLVDGTNSNTAAMALAHIQAICSNVKLKLMSRSASESNLARFVKFIPIFWFNRNLDGTWFVGLSELCSEITMVAILLPAAALVREKEYGTVEQLLVSPLHSWQIMLSKLIPMTGLVLLFTTLCLFSILVPVFGLYPKGSLGTYLLATAVYIGACSGLGMLLATAARNLSQVLLMLVAVMVPIMFLSGTWSPREAMPLTIRWFTYVSPLSYYLEVSNGIFFKGWNFSQSVGNLFWLMVFSGGLFLFGSTRISRQMG